MAFTKETMFISSSGFGELNCKIWCYTSADSRATILTNGYFSVELLINTGDLIYIKNGDTAPFQAYATAISPQITTVELPNAAQPANSITTAMLQDLCVTNEKVSHDISGSKLAPLSIPAGTLEAASIATADIQALSITNALIAHSSVDTDKIVAAAVTDACVATGISGAKLAAGSIPTGAYGAASIIGTDISPNTITATELGSLTGWVTSARIANGAVGTLDIAPAAVTNAKLGASRLIQVIAEVTTAAASDTFTVANALAGDFAMAQMLDNGAGVAVMGAAVTAGTVTVYYTGTAVAAENINIFLFRNGT